MLLLIAKGFFWLLGLMFLAGIIGSGIVVIMTSIEDARELRDRKEPEPTATTELRPEPSHT